MNRATTKRWHKFLICSLLLIWICGISVVRSHNGADDDSDEVEREQQEVPIRNGKLGERQQALRNALNTQLERLKSEQPEHPEDESKPQQRENYDTEEENSEEDEEREYNPWQDSFQDIYDDGTYVYGYSLPNGVTRYERSFYSDKDKGRVVEGFHTEPRFFGKRILYELRCYRADYYNGYRPLRVQYLKRPPIVRRDTRPNVDCFDK